ncbi:hypothetical protein NDU88_003352 [Pleurodeles waltl]|uniref:Uncharacterized protein n=1 Tax=Pleurodeles waltl TaxID=8319 RepID=A0AAV7SG96_PLEWA|nr:hypothetical protein NDU88_003352 [Pleurodeles waltl]
MKKKYLAHCLSNQHSCFLPPLHRDFLKRLNSGWEAWPQKEQQCLKRQVLGDREQVRLLKSQQTPSWPQAPRRCPRPSPTYHERAGVRARERDSYTATK